MKTIATWSANHLAAARILIAISHVIIAFLACYVGIELSNSEVFIPIQVFWIALVFMVVAFFIFRKGRYRSLVLSARKIVDVAVGISSFIIIIVSSNQTTTSHFVFDQQLKGTLPEKTSAAKKPSAKELKKHWRELTRMMQQKRASTGSIIAAIIVGLILTWLVAAAACGLSCGGHGGLALLVLIGGLTGVFFITRLIAGGGKRKRTATSATVEK